MNCAKISRENKDISQSGRPMLCAVLGVFFGLLSPYVTEPALANPVQQSTPYQFIGTVSSDSYAIPIRTNNHNLLIPRNFLETNTVNGDEVFFRMIITLPRFHGIEKTSYNIYRTLTSHAGWWNTGPPNIVWVYNASELTSAKMQWNAPILLKAGDQQGNNTIYGLGETIEPVLNERYYTHKSEDQYNAIAIKCYSVISELCRSAFDLAPGLVIEYEYSRNNLQNWQSIDEEVKRTLASFLEK